jgi:hypothetical protein
MFDFKPFKVRKASAIDFKSPEQLPHQSIVGQAARAQVCVYSGGSNLLQLQNLAVAENRCIAEVSRGASSSQRYFMVPSC